jgi:viroplasmin and RNaseH domain-containing protein
MPKFYAVKKGRQTGVFNTWTDCQKQVTGFSGAIFKSFACKQDAEHFITIDDSNEVKVEVQQDQLVVYTDGSCSLNKSASSAAYFPQTQEKYYLPDTGPAYTAPRSELTAILLALNILTDQKQFNKNIIIYSDSEYSVHCLTGLKNARANLDLIVRIRQIQIHFPRLAYVHVPGHAGIPGNEMADAIASGSQRDATTIKFETLKY